MKRDLDRKFCSSFRSKLSQARIARVVLRWWRDDIRTRRLQLLDTAMYIFMYIATFEQLEREMDKKVRVNSIKTTLCAYARLTMEVC